MSCTPGPTRTDGMTDGMTDGRTDGRTATYEKLKSFNFFLKIIFNFFY